MLLPVKQGNKLVNPKVFSSLILPVIRKIICLWQHVDKQSFAITVN